jgi:hypothetical protein
VPKSERIAEMSWIPEETVNPNEEDMVGEGKAWKRFLHEIRCPVPSCRGSGDEVDEKNCHGEVHHDQCYCTISFN